VNIKFKSIFSHTKTLTSKKNRTGKKKNPWTKEEDLALQMMVVGPQRPRWAEISHQLAGDRSSLPFFCYLFCKLQRVSSFFIMLFPDIFGFFSFS